MMGKIPGFAFISLLSLIICCHNEQHHDATLAAAIVETLPGSELLKIGGNEALLLTRFKSMEDFQRVVQISYSGGSQSKENSKPGKAQVTLVHRSGNDIVVSVLEAGISENDFLKAKNGNVWDKIKAGLRCSYAVENRNDLKRIEMLGRRRPWDFGKGDVAFYDLAEMMEANISDEDSVRMDEEDLSDKGYLNTFNHITAQAFMTSIFSEDMADFVADVHERYNLPELMSGTFTKEQLADLKNGPVDNYLDMINNEWGQELGKKLAVKYSISHDTHWTPTLMMHYLNDIQNYYSYAFQIGFSPFRSTDQKVIRFTNKVNKVMGNS